MTFWWNGHFYFEEEYFYMRTWDTLGAPNPFDACPTLAASIANMAIRSAEGPVNSSMLNGLSSAERTRFFTFDTSFANGGFPTYEETADAVAPLVRAQYLAAPDTLVMTDAARVGRALQTRVDIFNALTSLDDSE